MTIPFIQAIRRWQSGRVVAVLLVLAALHALVWKTRDRVIDGETIALILAIVSGVNVVLVVLLFKRYVRFAAVFLFSTYFLHFLYFLLFLMEQRGL